MRGGTEGSDRMRGERAKSKPSALAEAPARRNRANRVPGRSRVSLADVAAAASVSVMTVSNVVRARFDLVRPETYARVQAAIAELNYRPQIFGRALRTSQTRTIGLLIVISDENFLSSPWTSRMVAGLSNYLNGKDYGLLLHRHAPLNLEEALLLRLSNADGLCVMLSGAIELRRDLLSRITSLGQPVIALQEHLDPAGFKDMAIVRQDDYGGGVLIGRHLVARGARRLAFLGPAISFPAMSQRIDGIRSQVPAKRGFQVHSMECLDESVTEIEAAITQYLGQHGRPDAFIAANERLAFGLLASLAQRGLSAPRDVLVTCFNAFDLWHYALNHVTTIDFPAYELGVRAGQRIIERLERGRHHGKADVLPASLITRPSSGGHENT